MESRESRGRSYVAVGTTNCGDRPRRPFGQRPRVPFGDPIDEDPTRRPGPVIAAGVAEVDRAETADNVAAANDTHAVPPQD